MHDLVAFSPLRWDYVYQRPQDLLSRLARDRRVFYVEEPESTTGPACITARSPCAGVTVLRGQLPLDAAGFADALASCPASSTSQGPGRIVMLGPSPSRYSTFPLMRASLIMAAPVAGFERQGRHASCIV